MDVELCTTTGIKTLDDLLRGLVILFEASFPKRIQSYYLGGSYSDGTAVGHDGSPNSSDLDLFVIFHGTLEEIEMTTFQNLVGASRLISPIQIDAHAYAGDDLLQPSTTETAQTSFVNALIRVSSRLIYGEDIRAALPDIPFSRYVLDVIESGLYHLGIPRQRDTLGYPLVTPLVYPLAHPHAADEFYGYDAVPARPNAPRGTRVLVGITTWIATLVLALETGYYAGRKSQSLQLCKMYLPNDKRTQLAATITDLCKGTWGYALPEGAKGREQLRALCQDVLALENEYLWLCRNYVLAQLQQGGIQEQRQAMHILQSVVYRDDEMLAALRTLASSTDDSVRSGALQALEIVEDNYNGPMN